jgi:hypothetical protein
MPFYEARKISGEPDYGAVPTFDVTRFLTDVTEPATRGQFFLREGVGFEIVMWCFEERPRAIYHNPNDPVHTDSCMEAFVNYYPEMREFGYLSVEVNANAACHSSFGTGRFTRKLVLERGLPHPRAEVDFPTIEGRRAWRVRTLIKLELLKALYGRDDFPAGHAMRGNFYKCGDHTDAPHWGTWSKVEKIDFHTPEYFGEIVIA